MKELATIKNIEIKSIITAVPKAKKNTADYPFFSDAEKKTFIDKIGIISTHNSKGKITTVDLCVSAAIKTLQKLNWDSKEVDLLIFVSQTPDYTVPSSTFIIQDKLSLSKKTYLLDINHGCSGWVHALITASSLMKSLNFKKCLILNGETNIIAKFESKSVYPLMGDAGVCTAIELTNNGALFPYSYINCGEKSNSIIAKKSAARFISNKSKDERIELYTEMNGHAIYNFVVNEVKDELDTFVSGIQNYPKVDYYIFHQANKLLINLLAKKINLPIDKLLFSIKDFGNTSSASIPLTISFIGNGSDFLNNKSILCAAFGVGLSAANILINLNQETVLMLFDYEE